MNAQTGPNRRTWSHIYSWRKWDIAINPSRWLIGVEYYLAEWRLHLPCVCLTYRAWMR